MSGPGSSGRTAPVPAPARPGGGTGAVGTKAQAVMSIRAIIPVNEACSSKWQWNTYLPG
jgi:hypothetical protein